MERLRMDWKPLNDICTGADLGGIRAWTTDFRERQDVHHEGPVRYVVEVRGRSVFRSADVDVEAAQHAAEQWLAENVAAPLRPLLALLPVPEGHVRVRAATSATDDGAAWTVYGNNSDSDHVLMAECEHIGELHAGFITADVRIPQAPEIVGEFG